MADWVAAGVPEMMQVVVSIESPAGRVGLETQLVGSVPVRVGVMVVIGLPFVKL
jgi:hypothetical protein